jgi:hypothetical protein
MSRQAFSVFSISIKGARKTVLPEMTPDRNEVLFCLAEPRFPQGSDKLREITELNESLMRKMIKFLWRRLRQGKMPTLFPFKNPKEGTPPNAADGAMV